MKRKLLSKELFPHIEALLNLKGRSIKRLVLTLDAHEAAMVELTEFVTKEVDSTEISSGASTTEAVMELETDTFAIIRMAELKEQPPIKGMSTDTTIRGG